MVPEGFGFYSINRGQRYSFDLFLRRTGLMKAIPMLTVDSILGLHLVAALPYPSIGFSAGRQPASTAHQRAVGSVGSVFCAQPRAREPQFPGITRRVQNPGSRLQRGERHKMQPPELMRQIPQPLPNCGAPGEKNSDRYRSGIEYWWWSRVLRLKWLSEQVGQERCGFECTVILVHSSR